MIAGEAFPQGQLLEDLLEASQTGLDAYANSGELEAPARYRLAFRELGLSTVWSGCSGWWKLPPAFLPDEKFRKALHVIDCLPGSSKISGSPLKTGTFRPSAKTAT